MRANTTDPVADESMPSRAGIVGYRMPPLRPRTYTIRPGDRLVLATDGVRTGFRETLSFARSPQDAAGAILERYGKSTDDTCVIVARYRGVYDGLLQGKIDRSLFTDNANAYFDETAIKDFSASLGPLGKPDSFEQIGQSLRGGCL